jgi:hypothetical protein
MPISRFVLRAAGAAVALLTAGALAPGVAHAAPPDNDDFDAPTVVSALPFTVEQNTTESTAALDDPNRDCDSNEVSGSVWFRYTPAEDGLLRFTMAGSDRDLPVTVYTGERGDLRRADPVGGDCAAYRSSVATLRVAAGTTYHLMVSGGPYRTRGGALKLALERVTAPANDNFADAQPVTSLPFTGTQPDLAAASIETDEPYSHSCHASEHAGSVWYSYRPAQTQFVLAEVNSFNSSGPSLAVYEGTSLADLRPLACAKVPTYNGRVVEMVAGRTYYLQFRYSSYYQDIQAVPRLSVAPELRSYIYPGSLGDKSTYDPIPFTVSFALDYNAPVTSEWDFGDGTTVPPTTVKEQPHRYTADGRYTVTVRSRSADGRTSTATFEQVISTQNVEVTKFDVPASARAGETKPIYVNVRNHHKQVTVRVSVYKVAANGARTLVGERDAFVPGHPLSTISVPFNYTFTQEDANRGKTPFFTTVLLPSGLTDARPLDNDKTAETSVSQASAVRGES